MTLEEKLADLRARAEALPRDDGARVIARELITAATESLRRAHELARRAENALIPTPVREGSIRL